jgi:hypothetical protein
MSGYWLLADPNFPLYSFVPLPPGPAAPLIIQVLVTRTGGSGFPGMIACILVDWFLVAHLGHGGRAAVELVQAGPAYSADPLTPALLAIIGDNGPRMKPRARRDKFSEH